MDLAKQIADFARTVPQRIPHLQGEESTKQALILPFLAQLGYDVYNPAEVKAEFAADFATKKRGQFEKVDYALCIEGEVAILIEAKAHNQKTEVHSGQLARYFNSTPSARVAIVTNGIEYRFFTDLKEKNIMDSEPFMLFNVLDHDENELELLSRFTRHNFNPESISGLAEDIMCLQNITAYIYNQLQNPSESFVRLIIEDLNLRQRITSRVVERYTPVVRTAIRDALAELQAGQVTPAEATAQPTLKPSSPPPTRKPRENPTRTLPPLTQEEAAVVSVLKDLLAGEIQYMKDEDTLVVPNRSGSAWALRVNAMASKPHLIFNLSMDRARELVGHVFFFSHPLGTKANLSSLDDLYSMQDILRAAHQG